MPPNSGQTSEARTSVQSAEQELEEFTYMVSHDLGASFRHVSEFSRLLIIDLGETLTPKQRGYAQRIEAASGKCRAMMDQLLVYSRAQQKPLHYTSIDVTRLARVALSQRTADAPADVTIGDLGFVEADQDLLLQAISHLLDNAIKFTAPGQPPRVVVTAASDRTGWTLTVRDAGLGVAPQYYEKAFRMFQRLQAEADYPGLGVGLALCRRIARRHGGEVRFVDQGVGACVEMTLPRRGDLH